MRFSPSFFFFLTHLLEVHALGFILWFAMWCLFLMEDSLILLHSPLSLVTHGLCTFVHPTVQYLSFWRVSFRMGRWFAWLVFIWGEPFFFYLSHKPLRLATQINWFLPVPKSNRITCNFYAFQSKSHHHCNYTPVFLQLKVKYSPYDNDNADLYRNMRLICTVRRIVIFAVIV